MTQYLSTLKDFVQIGGEVAGIFFVGLVVGLIGALKRQKNSLKWSAARERRFVEKHTRIHEVLTELRVTIRASRALVFQFHNGGSFVDGGSIKRFSMTHESCETGITSVILDSQDVLLTRYTDLIGVMEQTPSKIMRTCDLSISPFRSALEINNVEFFTITPLKCEDGMTPLGFMCCHWCSDDSLKEIEAEGITHNSLEKIIFETSQTVNTYLTYNAGNN